jgi:hypothetical protein
VNTSRKRVKDFALVSAKKFFRFNNIVIFDEGLERSEEEILEGLAEMMIDFLAVAVDQLSTREMYLSILNTKEFQELLDEALEHTEQS